TIRLLEPSLTVCKAKLGPTDAVTLDTMNNLAWAYVLAARLPEAVAMFEETIVLMKSIRPFDDLEILNTTSNLGDAYWKAGKSPDAVRLLEPSLKICQSKLGAQHPITLSTMTHL